MIAPRFFPLVFKQVRRARMRSLLTIAGVAVAMFLFAAVQAMQVGVEIATAAQADDTTLIVYRKDRYCPYTSRMPQSYEQQIARIDGVKNVTPIKIVVSNCRTSLDVVTFRGVPKEDFAQKGAEGLDIIEGSIGDWKSRGDAALLGETLARRRGLKVGDRFEAAGITSYVAGVFRSDEPQHQNVAYVPLEFLQYASGSRAGGIVTQFNVAVASPDQLDQVAKAIDEVFASAQEPTQTSSEKAFVARAATDVIEIVSFMRYLGWGALAAVLALVANAIILSVQDRVKEHAILQTLGYRSNQVAELILVEGIILSLIGAIIGCVVAIAYLHFSGLALSVESHTIPIVASPAILVIGIAIAAITGVLAGLVPAWQAGSRDIVSCFRSA